MLRIAKSRGFLWQILGVTNPEQIKQTLEFWRKRAARQLTNEDARQITVNMTQFFEILAEWDKRDRKPPQSQISAPPFKKEGLNSAAGGANMFTMRQPTNTERIQAIAYARVSSKEQEKEGFSIAAQQKLLRQYASEQASIWFANSSMSRPPSGPGAR